MDSLRQICGKKMHCIGVRWRNTETCFAKESDTKLVSCFPGNTALKHVNLCRAVPIHITGVRTLNNACDFSHEIRPLQRINKAMKCHGFQLLPISIFRCHRSGISSCCQSSLYLGDKLRPIVNLIYIWLPRRLVLNSSRDLTKSEQPSIQFLSNSGSYILYQYFTS